MDPGIDAIDAELSRWVAETVSGVAVSFGAAVAEPKAPVVLLLLQRLADTTGARAKAGQPTPRRLELGYFVAVSARDPAQAHRTLGELLFSALERGERGDWRVSYEVPAAEFWTAHTLPPLPAFLLQVPLVRERPVPRTTMHPSTGPPKHLGAACCSAFTALQSSPGGTGATPPVSDPATPTDPERGSSRIAGTNTNALTTLTVRPSAITSPR